ncbi:TetR/AcrR family transcriptional regulator [Phaeovulum sp.]|uniref:TetR/AcrR family transcriptional regulator n=1 Tax=Phaeovulum sp. TaxID=2934796 RepID=UPI003565D28E
MRLFWAYGYQGAPIDLLCRETRMPRASLYQRYGDKQGLFLATIEHYVKTRITRVMAHLAAEPLDDALAGFFEAVCALATEDAEARGCLISCVLADAAGSNTRFRLELEMRFARMEARLAERLAQAQASGELAAQVEPEALAAVLAAVARGITVRARAGAPIAALRSIARSTHDMLPVTH